MAAKSVGPAVRVRALAKINLSLQITGVRRDGYHELRTVFQSIALHDTLTFRFGCGPFRLECRDPACPTDRTNLVWRAAERLWRASGRSGTLRDVTIRIDKRIPIQAGLGGGSSDAAATLRVLGARWRVKAARLGSIARSLAADVAYFLEGGTAIGLERGDVLYPLVDVPRSWIALVVPPFTVSTKDAYQWFDKAGGPKRVRPTYVSPTYVGRALLGPAGPETISSANDLERVVAARHPQITRIVNALRRAGATHAAMSGSGSAVFGLFSSRDRAARAARALASARQKTFVTRTVTRAEYQRLAQVK
jgi:4-diphosphocytidyl-2-C-methyl-D-erythritol kinase